MASTEGWINGLRSKAAQLAAGTGEWLTGAADRMGEFRSQGLDPEISKVPYEDRRVGQAAVETERRAAAGIGKTIGDVAAQSGVGQAEALNPAIKQTMPGINDTIKAAAQDLRAAPVTPAAPNMTAPNLVKPAYVAGENYDFGNGDPRTRGTSGGGTTPPPEAPAGAGATGEAPKAGGLRGKLAGLSKFSNRLGVLGGGLSALGAYDAASEGKTPEQQAGGSALRGGIAEFGDNMLLGQGRAAGTALGAGMAGFVQGKGLRDRFSKAMSGASQGWSDAKAAEASVSGVPAQVAAKPGVTSTTPVDTSRPALNTNQDVQSPQELINGTAVPAQGQGAFQRRGGQAQGLRAETFDGLGPMPDNATPEQAAEWLRKTNVINQGRQAANMAAQGTGTPGGDELAPLRRMAGNGVFGGLAALGAYGALDRMKSNQANLSLRQQQIQATNAATAAERARQQANTDREFANKVGQQNQESLDKEHTARAEAAVGGDTSIFRTTGDREAAVKAAKSDIVNRFNYSVADSGKDTAKMSGPEKQQLYQAMDVQKSVEASRSGIMQSAADYFGTGTRVNSKNAYSYMPRSVEPATRPGESWVVTMQNGNKIALKDLAGGQFQLLGPNVPVDADMMRLIQPLIDRQRRGLR